MEQTVKKHSVCKNLAEVAMKARENGMSYGKYVAALEKQKPKTGLSAKDVIRLENERYRIEMELKHSSSGSVHSKSLEKELKVLKKEIIKYKKEMGLVGGFNTPMH